LSLALIDSFNLKEKQLVITNGESILSKPLLDDASLIATCTHKEADTSMLLHAHDLALHRYDKLLIRTVDTDVVVLAIAVMQELGRQVKLYIAFGTGKYFRYIAVHEIAHSLGPQKAKVLPMFHALTGCDTVSSFVGHGKRTAWSTWNALPQLIDVLLQLSCMPSDIQ